MKPLIALPLAAYALFFRLADPAGGRRAAGIHAAVLWGVTATVLTEALGLFHALTPWGLAGGWLAVDLAAAGYGWLGRAGRRQANRLPHLSAGDLETALLSGVLLLLAGVGAAALLAPPNTTDAMTYHLPRIVHWLHNRGVGFYATPEIRQLQMPPWAEYAMLQLHGLSGGDRFDSLVQWFSLAGCVTGVSLIAGLLGAGMRGQVLAAVLCATLPQGLLEASGAKNDCVAAFWMVALVYYLLRFGREASLPNALGIGGALGLACLTKSVAFVTAPPLLAALLLPRMFGQPKGAWVRGLAIAAVLALGLNAPHFVRNYRLFHSILGPAAEIPPTGYQYTNGRFGVRPLLSNVLRNLALHAGTPSGAFNHAEEAAVVGTLAAVGEDANDPYTTWDNTGFHVPPLALHEATAGNPLHAVLILLACAILVRQWKAAPHRPALWLALGLAGAFLLFCAVFRWQPWHTRLHLPFFVLGTAVAGTVLARFWPRGVAPLGMLLLLSATPEVFANQLRPLLGANWNVFHTPRQELYFADLGDLWPAYRDAAQFLESSHCPEIGLDLGQGGNEYPLDALLHNLTGSRPLRNVAVTNASRVYDRGGSDPPACLICAGCPLRAGWTTLARPYRRVKQFGSLSAMSDPGPAAANVCTAEFSGWYPVEQAGGDWWRWSAGTGVVQVRAAQGVKADLEAEVLSARYPNRVELLVNGERQAQLEETADPSSQLVWVPVELQPGGNTLEFRSGNGPVQLARDPRRLSIALRNLVFRNTGPAGCAVDDPR